ncbi:MAG: Ig-like domain repeat protein [Terriglobales bacterium]
MRPYLFGLRFTLPSVVLLGLSTLAAAQQKYIHPLISEPVDEGRRVVLKGNVHPLARPQFEVAEAPPNLPMERMLLVLKRSPEQEAALSKLLDDQQDKSSIQYHKWVTPEQFGQQFGPADSDIHAVTSWLQGHGFEVSQVSKGRTVIEFSGTAAQVQETFHTAIRKYVVKGEAHWANASDPEIPHALAPVVAGVNSLHNFYTKPQIGLSPERAWLTVSPGAQPQVTFSDGTHALTPADYRVIYNATPTLSSGINGQGQAIAVVARSNLFNGGQDVSEFENTFGFFGGRLNIILNGPDPGDLGGGEEAEATLDATWASVMAPVADVDFVVSAGTNATDGIFLSESYIIDNNLAPVMTESFGGCESGVPDAEAQAISAMAEQAAAQGITYIVGSGDTGAEGCDSQDERVAAGPVSVSVLASTPFNIAVGGTQFNENGHGSTYWKTVNGSDGLSAKSYIPENVWNQSCTYTQCNSNENILAGGGGASAIFSKPSWQSGVTGIPKDGARDLPDVSLSAGGHDPYLLCYEGSCQSGFVAEVFGTSASAPSFAGIMALVDQKTGSRQGQANYVLYRLAAGENLSQCNASKTTALPATTCIFNDVTVGNNAVPGEVGFGTASAKYQSTVGYDLATGLGSVNVANLVNQWSSTAFTASTTTLTLSPTTFTHGADVDVGVVVAPTSGAGVPTGDVSLLTSLSPDVPGATAFTLNSGAVSSAWNGLPGGTYEVHAHYAGDGTFAASDSAPVMITVSPEASTTTLVVGFIDVFGNLDPITTQVYGNPTYLRSDVSGVSGHGVASGNVVFTYDGASIASTGFNLNSEGTATTAQGVFTIPAGQHSMVASYDGEAGLNASSSPPVNITVIKAPTSMTLIPSNPTVIQGEPVTLTATVSTQSGGFQPTGLVTLLSGGSPIIPGSPAPLGGRNGFGNIQSGALVTAQGIATSLVILPPGQNIISAQYPGDTNYAGSSSTTAIVNVQADFGFAAESPSITIASPGGSGTMMLTVTGQPGYGSTINFSATSCAGLPRESACTFSPASVTGSGSTTLTISTKAAHSVRLEAPGWWFTSFGGTLAGVFLLGGASRRRSESGRRRTVFALIVFALLVTIAGCGGGSGSTGSHNQDPGTPAGSSIVTVNATTGIITHSVTVSLTVQ